MIDYQRPRPAEQPQYPEPLLLLLASVAFWCAHLVSEAGVGYVYFIGSPLRTLTAVNPAPSRAWQEDYLISTFIEAWIGLIAAAVFFGVPFLLWCTGRFDARKHPAARGAACGVAFCLIRWGIWYFSESRANGLGMITLCAGLLSIALVQAKSTPG
jgi:hypothetical protein